MLEHMLKEGQKIILTAFGGRIEGIGRQSLEELKALLRSLGLNLGIRIKESLAKMSSSGRWSCLGSMPSFTYLTYI